MEAPARQRHGSKRRRFRNPWFLAAGVLVVALSILYAYSNGVWAAAAGPQAPSLLSLVGRFPNAADPHRQPGQAVFSLLTPVGAAHDA